MSEWPPRDSMILRAALPAAFTGLVALAGWMLAESRNNSEARVEVRQLRKELDALQVKVQSMSDGRFEDNRSIQQKLNDIRVTVARIESALDSGRRGGHRKR